MKGRSFVMKGMIWGLLIPFLGTTAGSACVFFMKKEQFLNVI